MVESKPVPSGYGSLMNVTSVTQRFPGLLIDKGILDDSDLEEIGVYSNDKEFVEDYAKVLQNDGLLEEDVLEENYESFDEALKKSVLRAGLRREVNEGYIDGELELNRSESMHEYLCDSGLMSSESHIQEYLDFFVEEGVFDEEEIEENRDFYEESISKLVTKAMLDHKKNAPELHDEEYMRPVNKYVWNQMEQELGVEAVPIQIDGERGYWAEPSARQGSMLGAIESDNQMTVMALIGLEDEFYDRIIADENKSGEIYTVKEENIQIPEEIEDSVLENTENEIPEKTRYLLMNPGATFVNPHTAKPMNKPYHELIKEVDQILAEKYGRKVGDWFIEQYEEETRVNPTTGLSTEHREQIEEIQQKIDKNKNPEERQILESVRDEMINQDLNFSNTLHQQQRAIKGFQKLMNGELANQKT